MKNTERTSNFIKKFILIPHIFLVNKWLVFLVVRYLNLILNFIFFIFIFFVRGKRYSLEFDVKKKLSLIHSDYQNNWNLDQ